MAVSGSGEPLRLCPLGEREICRNLDQRAPGLQLYTGNRFDGTLRGAGGAPYGPHAGVALETQHFPDSPSNPQFPATDLRPGETYESITELIFGGRPESRAR